MAPPPFPPLAVLVMNCVLVMVIEMGGGIDGTWLHSVRISHWIQFGLASSNWNWTGLDLAGELKLELDWTGFGPCAARHGHGTATRHVVGLVAQKDGGVR